MDSDTEAEEKAKKEGILMGKRLYYSERGAFGITYDVVQRARFQPSYSPLLVKQLAKEYDQGRELHKEYSIARFLEMNLPSFVAGPFGLMRGVITPEYDEKLSFIQQRIHGMTFNSIGQNKFSILELCAMFLQCNEFFLRVGGSLMMEDVNNGNVMVDLKDKSSPRVKFIDFGFWRNDHGYPYYHVMLRNFCIEGHPMKRLLAFMGLPVDSFEKLYAVMLKSEKCDAVEIIYDLPSRIKTLLHTIPELQNITENAQFKVIEKLCSIRLVQNNLNIPMDIISEFVALNHTT